MSVVSFLKHLAHRRNKAAAVLLPRRVGLLFGHVHAPPPKWSSAWSRGTQVAGPPIDTAMAGARPAAMLAITPPPVIADCADAGLLRRGVVESGGRRHRAVRRWRRGRNLRRRCGSIGLRCCGRRCRTTAYGSRAG